MLTAALTTVRPSNPTPAVLECAQKIADHIRSGQIKPMQKLAEGSLSRQFGIGRARVRAALDHLAYSGIVDRRPQSGTYVRCLTLADLVECSAYRGLLEGFAARDACQRISPAELRDLERHAVKLDASGTAGATFAQLRNMDVAFHLRISDHSTSANIRNLLHNQHFVTRYLIEHRLLNLPTMNAKYKVWANVPTHRKIVQTLLERNPDLAEHVMRKHVLGSVYVAIVRYTTVHADDSDLVADGKIQLERLKGWLGEPFIAMEEPEP